MLEWRAEISSQIASFLRMVGRQPRSLLMLDYDGTLAPFRRERDQAFPYPGVTPVLQDIVRIGRTRVVIVSGRDVSETVSLLNIQPCPEIWGLHGRQRQIPSGIVQSSPLDSATLDALSDADRWLGYQHLRHHAEFKKGSIAVHWRGLSATEGEQIRDRVLLGWRPIAENADLAILHFDGGIEIRPCGIDKGDAVRAILQEVSTDAPAVYLGDDTTDEPAFVAMRGRGLSILVGLRRRPSAAQVWLQPPDELLAFLVQWLSACQGCTVPNGKKAMKVAG